MDVVLVDELVDDAWVEEVIPATDTLYLRVHFKVWNNGLLVPGAFRNQPDRLRDGMSTNWCKYSDAQLLLEQAPQDAENYGVVSLRVAKVRDISDQVIKHDPDRTHDNRAHTVVNGRKDIETRAEYLECFEVAVWPGNKEQI